MEKKKKIYAMYNQRKVDMNAYRCASLIVHLYPFPSCIERVCIHLHLVLHVCLLIYILVVCLPMFIFDNGIHIIVVFRPVPEFYLAPDPAGRHPGKLVIDGEVMPLAPIHVLSHRALATVYARRL